MLIVLHDDSGLAAWSPYGGGSSPMENAYIAEVLRENGYNTFWLARTTTRGRRGAPCHAPQ